MGPEEVDVVSREIEIIKSGLQASVNRQKKYTQNRRQPFEFEVGDQVFLKVSPMMGVMRFGKKGKLSSRYVRLSIGEVAYRFALPPALLKLHDIFHVNAKEVFA